MRVEKFEIGRIDSASKDSTLLPPNMTQPHITALAYDGSTFQTLL